MTRAIGIVTATRSPLAESTLLFRGDRAIAPMIVRTLVSLSLLLGAAEAYAPHALAARAGAAVRK